ncbi:PKD domain-containing protein [Dactylosporangium sp. CA-233914]|uniref:PKD domain-containing protein n=1 Tax=Dactylosporangium sp. CA-233914 TaxID=3239934 RepID=UPI003D8DF0F4
MRPRLLTGLAITAVASGAVLTVGVHPAGADVPVVLYVNNTKTTSITCSDTGPGSSAQPYCTIAAGVAAVQPGQTLSIVGQFAEHVTIAKSGTPTAPITIQGGSTKGADAGLTIDGQHDIIVEYFQARDVVNGPAIALSNSTALRLTNVGAYMNSAATSAAVSVVAVTDSVLQNVGFGPSSGGEGVMLGAATSGVTLDHPRGPLAATGTTAIDIAGSHNTVSGPRVTGGSVAAIALQPGARDNTIVNGDIESGAAVGILNNGATGTAIANNAVKDNCGTGIRIAGSSSGVSVQNNLVSGNGAARTGCTPPADAVNIGVYDGAVGHTVVDYNNVHQDAGPADYAWSTPMTPAQFRAASGQAGHDAETVAPTAVVDSANSAAPGYPSVDGTGQARSDNPKIADTGTGSVSYTDRGPAEFGPGPHAWLFLKGPQIGLTVNVGDQSTPGYGYLPARSIDWGDGTPVDTSAAHAHTYAKPGPYTVTLTVTDSYGLTDSASMQVWPAPDIREAGLLAVANNRFVTQLNDVTTPLMANGTAAGAPQRFQLVDAGNGFVGIRTPNSFYVGVDPSRGDEIVSNWPEISDTGLFQLITNADGSISLKAVVNGKYVTADAGGAQPLTANRTAIGPWEKFHLADMGKAGQALRAHANSRYVTAESTGANPLIANRTTIGPWEQFDFIDAGGGYIALYSRADGKLVTAENAGAGALIANRTAIGDWEQFQLVTNADGSISLKAKANGRYVTAEAGGVQPLIANRTAIGQWEEFDLAS